MINTNPHTRHEYPVPLGPHIPIQGIHITDEELPEAVRLIQDGKEICFFVERADHQLGRLAVLVDYDAAREAIGEAVNKGALQTAKIVKLTEDFRENLWLTAMLCFGGLAGIAALVATGSFVQGGLAAFAGAGATGLARSLARVLPRRDAANQPRRTEGIDIISILPLL